MHLLNNVLSIYSLIATIWTKKTDMEKIIYTGNKDMKITLKLIFWAIDYGNAEGTGLAHCVVLR
jgi:hypothetical protein